MSQTNPFAVSMHRTGPIRQGGRFIWQADNRRWTTLGWCLVLICIPMFLFGLMDSDFSMLGLGFSQLVLGLRALFLRKHPALSIGEDGFSVNLIFDLLSLRWHELNKLEVSGDEVCYIRKSTGQYKNFKIKLLNKETQQAAYAALLEQWQKHCQT